jgi:hypothetical protein
MQDQELRDRLDRLEKTMGGLYLPGPTQAEADRPRKPVELQRIRIPVLQIGPHTNGPYTGTPIWTSPCLETHGFSHQDAFVSIQVWRDNVTLGLGFEPVFLVELQGAVSSAFCMIDNQVVVTNGAPGLYPVPTLSAASNSLEVRIQIFAADNTDWTPPAGGRLIEISVDGYLVAGYEM